MKVLIIGGTGCISTDVTALAAKREDMELYVLNRGIRSPNAVPGVRWISADIHNQEEVRKKTREIFFDVVADFISFNAHDLQNTLELFRSRMRQFIFISSATAYRKTSLSGVITENNTPVENMLWSYARGKVEAEYFLQNKYRDFDIDYTIVRPYVTYNNIRFPFAIVPSHSQSWSLANRMLQGKPVIMWDDGTALCTLTHASDFAKGFIGLFANSRAYGEAYHITSDEYLTWKRVAEITAEALGVDNLKLLNIPSHVLTMELGPEIGEMLFTDKGTNMVFDSSKIKRLVPEFLCSTPFAEGIRKTIDFYRKNPERQKINLEWDQKMDYLVGKYYHE